MVSEFASNDWAYNFKDPFGWERPLLRLVRADHTVRVTVVEHKGPLHCDVCVNGQMVVDAVGGLERRHIGEAFYFGIEDTKPPPPKPVFEPRFQRPVQVQIPQKVLTPIIMPPEQRGVPISPMQAPPQGPVYMPEVKRQPKPPKSWEDLKVGLIVDSGEKCGIAEHTSYFLNKLKCNLTVYALKDDNLYRLAGSIVGDGIDVLHIEHEYSLFPNAPTQSLLRDARASGIKTVLDMHTVTPSPDTKALIDLADRVVVHNPGAKAYYDLPKIETIPLATPVPEDVGKVKAREAFSISGGPVIASFGFVNSSKGLIETLEAVRILRGEYPDIKYLIIGSNHPRNNHQDLINALHSKSSQWGMSGNVMFFSDFYPIETVISILQATDVTCLFYKRSTYASASSSGPARICLASHRPLVVSDIPMFYEFNDAVLRTEETNVPKLAETISKLLKDEGGQKDLVEKGDKILAEINGDSIARKFESIYRQLGCSGN